MLDYRDIEAEGQDRTKNPVKRLETSKFGLPVTAAAAVTLIVVSLLITKAVGDLLINALLFGIAYAFGRWHK